MYALIVIYCTTFSIITPVGIWREDMLLCVYYFMCAILYHTTQVILFVDYICKLINLSYFYVHHITQVIVCIDHIIKVILFIDHIIEVILFIYHITEVNFCIDYNINYY